MQPQIRESCEWIPLQNIRQYTGYDRGFFEIDGVRHTFTTISIRCGEHSVPVICELFNEAVRDVFACALQDKNAFICWRMEPTFRVDDDGSSNLTARLLVSSNAKLLDAKNFAVC
jgi:hypothetical protein